MAFDLNNLLEDCPLRLVCSTYDHIGVQYVLKPAMHTVLLFLCHADSRQYVENEDVYHLAKKRPFMEFDSDSGALVSY